MKAMPITSSTITTVRAGDRQPRRKASLKSAAPDAYSASGPRYGLSNLPPIRYCDMPRHTALEDVLRRLVESTDCECEDHAEACVLLGTKP